MGQSTPVYRAFHLDADGRVARAEVVEAASDHEALALLHSTINAHGVELWDRARIIGKADPLNSGENRPAF